MMTRFGDSGVEVERAAKDVVTELGAELRTRGSHNPAPGSMTELGTRASTDK